MASVKRKINFFHSYKTEIIFLEAFLVSQVMAISTYLQYIMTGLCTVSIIFAKRENGGGEWERIY